MSEAEIGFMGCSPVEKFMLKRGYAPICNGAARVIAWQKVGDHEGQLITSAEADKMQKSSSRRARPVQDWLDS